MKNNIILGEGREFELVGKSSNFEKFYFKIKKFGEDIGKTITVKLYGGIKVPQGIGLTDTERNRLHMKAIYEYKKNCFF